MVNMKTVFLLNWVTIVVVGLITLVISLCGGSVKGLFSPPCSATYPGAGFFFLAFQMSFYVAVMVCAFTYGLLRKMHPGQPENRFILTSALLTGFFLFNEVFRTHVHLGRAGFPKVTVVIVYALLALFYALAYKRIIRATPYTVLLCGVGLLFMAFVAEALHLQNELLSTLLEGIPKMLSGVNCALYYWIVCHGLVVRELELKGIEKTVPGTPG